MRQFVGQGPGKIQADNLQYKAFLDQQSPPSPMRTQQPRPAATIDSLWADHNVQLSGGLGIVIHATFSVVNLLYRTGTVAAHFLFTNGVPLWDTNRRYHDAAGRVCALRSFAAKDDPALFQDFRLVMPYDELHVGAGNHSLKFSFSLWDDRARSLAWADGPPFTFGYR